jgi:hypothetical protein
MITKKKGFYQVRVSKTPDIRLWRMIPILLITVLFVGCSHPSKSKQVLPPQVKAANLPAQSERLLVVGAEPWLITKTLPEGEWVIKDLAGIEALADDYELYGPVIALSDRVILLQVNTPKGSETTQYRLYQLDGGADALLPKEVFQEPPREIRPPLSILAWLPAERKILFTVHAGEGFAGHGLLRLLDSQQVKSTFAGEDAEVKRLSKALGGEYDALNYSPDGKLLVAGHAKRVALLNRATKEIKILKAPVTFFWALSIAADNRTIAWLGETKPWEKTPEEEAMDKGMDYFPRVDHIGIINIASGKDKTWALDTQKGATSGQEPNQMWARIAYSPKSKSLYFIWESADQGRVIVCFDTSSKIASVISNAGSFTLIADPMPNTRAAPKGK